MSASIETLSTDVILKPFQKLHPPLYQFSPEIFLNMKEDVYEEAVRLSYANMSIPDVSEGIEPILRSNLLRTPIEFSLSTLCEKFDLPNKCDLVT